MEFKVFQKEVELQSIFTWNYDDETGYVFTAKIQDGKYDGVIKSDGEGITTFKKIDWIINDKNYGVVEDLKVFIKDIKLGVKHNYHMVYKDKTLVDVIQKD